MHWLNNVVDELLLRFPEGEVVVSSGVSPSGTYHLGTLREVLTAEAIHREVKRRGRQSRHIHVVDDMDVFRKVPVGVPTEFEQYLGKPLCDVPAPDGSEQSYADYFLNDLLIAAEPLKLDMEVMRAHEKYRSGYFVEPIEKALTNISVIKKILEDVSGRSLDENWSPVQVIEDGYLKNRPFISIDTEAKLISYAGRDGVEKQANYQVGEVELNWRIDWPARWWKLGVNAEPFGRDHATKGGSYDTGILIAKEVYGIEAPLPVPYNFINRTGDTKKMSKSSGDTITAADLLKLLPAEIVWFFVLRYAPDKLLFFDEGPTLIRLVDEYAEIAAKIDKSEEEQQLLEICGGSGEQTVSRIPFSHLVASYQAALKDADKTLDVMRRTEHAETVNQDETIIKKELGYIHEWLERSAPLEVKFDLRPDVAGDLSDVQKQFVNGLAAKVEQAPEDADGEWFHQAIYEFKESLGLQPKELFVTLYNVLIGKDAGPRAGWFLSLLPRDWLVKRLKLED
jgi:lysyl-tRNA synthetase class 1